MFRRRHLPHVDVPDKPYFVTGVLRGSVAASGLDELRRYQDALAARPKPDHLTDAGWEQTKHKLVFAVLDNKLDNQPAVRHLADERCARVVANAFRHFADERYRLIAYLVMPSHHHWLFLPIDGYFAKQPDPVRHQRTPREQISHSIQSYTATECNRILGRSGPFWLEETYDHYARDSDELHRIAHYIEQNPVKAGLADRPEDWRWSSAHVRFQLGLAADASIPK